MPISFTFVPSQNQTFELRCEKGVRSLPQADLAELIDQCEQTYYSGRRKDSYGQFVDEPQDLVRFGQTLYGWLDGREGWLRSQASRENDLTIYLGLDLPADMAALNDDTQRVALGLAHLPWELLHDGRDFLMARMEGAVLPVRRVRERTGEVAAAQNRPLRLLFMATSPDAPGIASLQYEAEEANILQAIRKQNQVLDLVVEESGSVEELRSLVQAYEADHFDVFHLTGHGFIHEGEPCFVTEDDYGQPVFSTARDLAGAFRNRWPRVVFLSGCHTGEVPNGGTVPSMAAALIRAGAPVVLGWARPVFDRTAIVAAEALYQSLAAAMTVEEAVRAAQQEMIRRYLADSAQRWPECSDWHLLRMYRDSREVAALVTPPRGRRGRAQLRQAPVEKAFLDDKGEIKVASRTGFVGRRRPLQRCLRAMRETSEQIGVYIQGLGGLGKSTLAARICTRVRGQRSQFEQVVIVGPLDEQRLLNELSRKYERYGLAPLLNQPQVSLRGRLQNFFEAIEGELDKPLLLVLDDFEQNIPRQYVEDGSLRLTETAYRVLEAIGEALPGGVSRLIVTCRYHRAEALPPSCRRLHLEGLHRMSAADVAKKQRLIANEPSERKQPIAKTIMDEIVEAADGNPRLLEWLTAAVKEGLASEELLVTLRATEEKFREDVLAQKLLAALSEPERQGLARLSAVQLPIEIALMPEIFWAGAAEQSLHKLSGLGLVEKSQQGAQTAKAYRVSQILEPLLRPVLSEAEWQEVYNSAVRRLHVSWWQEDDDLSELKGLEIVRLGLLAKEQEISVVVGCTIANIWYQKARFFESLKLSQQLSTSFEDYRILSSVGQCEHILGQTEAALSHYQKALALCHPEDLVEKASLLNRMAQVISQYGDNHQALELWHQALEISRSINDNQGQALILGNIAVVTEQQGHSEQAIEFYQISLETLKGLGNKRGEATTLNNMAQIVAQQGDSEKAISFYWQAKKILEDTGDIAAYATTLSNVAKVIAQQGDSSQAMEIWQDALAIQKRIGNVKEQANTLNYMGLEISHQGDIDNALKFFKEAAEIHGRIKNAQGEADAINNMAQIFEKKGSVNKALNLWRNALAIHERTGYMQGKATVLNNMAHAINREGDYEQALSLWQEDLEISQQIGDVRGEATTLNNMAEVAFTQGELEEALKLFKKSAQSLSKAKAYSDLPTVLVNLHLAEATNDQSYLAQIAWLALRVQVPLKLSIYALNELYCRIPAKNVLEGLLGTTALYLCNTHGENHPDLQQLQNVSFTLLFNAAIQQGKLINTSEELRMWMASQQLDNPGIFLPKLNTYLESVVDEDWLFDRTPILIKPFL